MPKPDIALVEKVMRTLTTAEDVDYFFDNLTSSDWIEPLATAGLFASPPEPIPVDGGVQLPSWSASRYLARMAERSPEQVRAALLAMPRTENVRVLHDYADAVIAMPPAMAVEFLPTMISWLDSPFQLLLPSKLAQLLRRLATAGLVDGALALAQALFKLRPGRPLRVSGDNDDSFDFRTEAEPVIESYAYERLLHESRSDLIAGTGLQGLAVLSDLLVTAMTLEASDPEESKRDSSYIWRPAIEPHSQNSVPSVRNSIVTAVRDAAVQLATADRRRLADVVTLLEEREWSVLRRIALEVIRVTARRRSGLVSSRLTSTDYIYDIDLHHEYWTLLHDRFLDLTSQQQSRVLDAIKDGPPVYRDPEGPYGDDSEAALKAWQARILAAISKNLPPEEAAWFEQLVSEHRLADHPEFLSYSDGGFVGPVSPLSDDDFTAMSEDELLDFLSTWAPEAEWGKPSPEGLGHLLETAVRDNPSRYAQRLERFGGLQPTYLNSILQGFRNAAAGGQAFPWRPVLQLAKSANERGRKLRDEGQGGDRYQPWAWTRSTTAHLLDVGFNNGPAQIPFELRQEAWAVLAPLTEDPDPTVESEQRYGGSNMDPSTLAINTVRGAAIEAAIKYAVWVHRHIGPSGESPPTTGLNRMPEVRDVLDRHLDLNVDPSYAVHSLYGQWFPWLRLVDERWTEANVPSIFPVDESRFLYWEAAWDAYIGFCQPYDSSLKLLKEEYRRAIRRLAAASHDQKHPFLVQQNLANHLMIYYLRGRLPLHDPLLQDFYSAPSTELHSVAMGFAGRTFYVLADRTPQPLTPPAPPEIVDRAVTLWETRRAIAEAAEDKAPFGSELAEFGWWFIAPSFDADWSLGQLLAALRLAGSVESGHLVIRRLAELGTSHPEQVLDALQLMIRGDSDDWLILGEDSVTEILRSALHHPESEAIRGYAEQLTHELGARGYRQFRVLLKPTS